MKTAKYSSINLEVEHERQECADPKSYFLHAHDYFEICYFLEGNAIYHIEGNEYPISPGDIILLRPGEAHYIQVYAQVPFERILLSFGQRFIEAIDPDHSLRSPFFNRALGYKNLYRPTDFIGLNLQQHLNQLTESTNRVQIIKSLLDFLQELNLAFAKMQDYEQLTETLEDRIIRLITDEYHLKLSLQDLADRFFVSRTQLYRRFKLATGVSIGKYITVKRLTAARDLILQGRKVSDVSVMCGFQDYSTFYRSYTRYFGHSPQAERKRNYHTQEHP